MSTIRFALYKIFSIVRETCFFFKALTASDHCPLEFQSLLALPDFPHLFCLILPNAFRSPRKGYLAPIQFYSFCYSPPPAKKWQAIPSMSFSFSLSCWLLLPAQRLMQRTASAHLLFSPCLSSPHAGKHFLSRHISLRCILPAQSKGPVTDITACLRSHPVCAIFTESDSFPVQQPVQVSQHVRLFLSEKFMMPSDLDQWFWTCGSWLL